MGKIQPKTGRLVIGDLPKERLSELNEFISNIKDVRYFKPDGKPNKGWRIFYGETLAEAWVAAMDAAWVAAMSVERFEAMRAVRDAAWVAAMNATKLAAMEARRSEAWTTAWDAARNAAWNAVGAAKNASKVAAGDAGIGRSINGPVNCGKRSRFQR